MNTRFLRHAAPIALALASMLPLSANAHRGWLLPSATVLSGNEPWVTVDAAVSNELFSFEHVAGNLDLLQAYAPDGSKATPENLFKGRYRSVFDLKLTQKGTYKMALINDGLNASFKVGGESKRVRGDRATVAKGIPANATDVNVSRNLSRIEIFVTSGKPTDTVLKPTNKGLELVPITHPNDLFAGDAAKFQFVVDGKPAADLDVLVTPGGARYRTEVGEIRVKTDAEGKFSVTWPTAGMYYLNASHGGAPRAEPGAARPPAPVGTLDKPAQRSSYAATFEILPQ